MVEIYFILSLMSDFIIHLCKNRYLKREAEPKDNELWSGNKPNLQQSTYKILGKNLKDDVIS